MTLSKFHIDLRETDRTKVIIIWLMTIEFVELSKASFNGSMLVSCFYKDVIFGNVYVITEFSAVVWYELSLLKKLWSKIFATNNSFVYPIDSNSGVSNSTIKFIVSSLNSSKTTLNFSSSIPSKVLPITSQNSSILLKSNPIYSSRSTDPSYNLRYSISQSLQFLPSALIYLPPKAAFKYFNPAIF